MNSGQAIVLCIAALAVVAIAFGIFSRRRDQKLREHFGEYDGAPRGTAEAPKSEAVLAFRGTRHKVGLRPLTDAERSSFVHRWDYLETRFVDDPKGSLAAGDSLVAEAMQARGYLISETEPRAPDIPPSCAYVVENYLGVREFALRLIRDDANTEDLRQAMVRYRIVLHELLREQGQSKRSA